MRHAIALILLSSAAALAAPQGPPYADKKRNLEKQQEAARAARDEARKGGTAEQVVAWLADDSAHVRDAVFDVLVEKKDEALLKKLESQLGHKDELVASSIAELFGLVKYAAGRGALEKIAQGGPEPVALEAVWALEAIGGPESAAAMRKVIDKRKEPRLRGDALVALAGLDPQAAREEVAAAQKDKQPMVRMAALLALLKLDPPAGVAAAIDEVAAEEPSREADKAPAARLLSCALDVIRRWSARAGQKELAVRAVEALIARLRRMEEGLGRYLVGVTLADLTGETSPGEDAELWDGWWKVKKESWTPVDRPPDAPKARRPGKKDEEEGEAKGRQATGQGQATRVRFHGVPVRSKRLVFIQDLSGGMNNPLDKDDASSPSKMKFAKDETVRVVSELPEDVHANVLFFATEWYKANERLLPLAKARAGLIEFVGKQETPDTSAAQNRHKGRSNLFDTLVTALLDPEIDTVFFVSEGGPTEGRYVDEARFMRHIERLNRYQRVQIHGFLVSNSTDGARFLRKLAEMSEGEFHDLAGKKKEKK